ncbi:MAG: class I SAM-dependent methyltransferase [Myxococcota bacterium]
MEPRYLELAAELCELARKPDLFSLLGLPADADASVCADSMMQFRRKMQSMQANPKWKDVARFTIKHNGAILSVLEEPEAYHDYLRRKAEDATLPSLTLAIDGILADGIVSAAEERFAGELARNLGISEETFWSVLRDRADAAGVTLPSLQGENQGAQARALGWWDARFTRLLLESIPEGSGHLVDVYCRMAWSALTILPRRKKLTYLGFDRNAERVELARSSIQGLGSRVALQVGHSAPLPLPNESVDIVLAVRALQTRDDTRPVLAEAYRVLREGGRCIVVEPDGLAENFYFDGPLDGYTLAFRNLVYQAEVIRQRTLLDVPPVGRGGMVLGPQLFARLRHAGFTPRELTVHASQNLWEQSVGDLVKRLRAYPRAIARAHNMGRHSPEWQAILQASVDIEAEIGSDAVGLGGNLLPLFIATGVKS